MKNIWKKIQGDPVFMQKVNGWQAIIWFVFIIPANIFGWVFSVALISNLSIIALAIGAWSAWQASRVEVAQMNAAEEMVDKMVEKTTVEKL